MTRLIYSHTPRVPPHRVGIFGILISKPLDSFLGSVFVINRHLRNPGASVERKDVLERRFSMGLRNDFLIDLNIPLSAALRQRMKWVSVSKWF